MTGPGREPKPRPEFERELEGPEDEDGGAPVREPRRPKPKGDSGGAVLTLDKDS